MRNFEERKFLTISFLAVMAAFLVAFQNCSGPLSFSSLAQQSANNGNGTGYDGKPFVTIGVCDSTTTQVAVKGKILLSTGGSGQVVRQNCQDLAVPQPIEPSEIRRSMIDSNVVVYKKEIYDYFADDPTVRKLTRALCWQTSSTLTSGVTTNVITELSVWYFGDALLLNSNHPELFGEAKVDAGEDTGTITQVNENYTSSTSVNYSAYTPVGNGLSLSIYSGGTSVYGNFYYKYLGVPSNTVGTQDCYLQAPTFP